MDVNLLITDGKGKFTEVGWSKPEIADDEIEVKAIMTGVCRSDIDMMTGEFDPLPIHMSGHEGLGLVTKIGDNINNVNPGDFVATRGEPAYADYYNVKYNEYVVVPEAHPRYILEPVACGINVIEQNMQQILQRTTTEFSRILIRGTGFLAYCAYRTLKQRCVQGMIDIVGKSNRDLWNSCLDERNDELLDQSPRGYYDVVIDLKGCPDTFTSHFRDNALLIVGSNMQVNMNLQKLLWGAVTINFPSPRNPNFIECMRLAEAWITNGVLNVDSFWTRSYNRTTEWQKAFADGLNRPNGYSRGYIKWD